MTDRHDAIGRFAWSLRDSWRLAVAVVLITSAVVVGGGFLLLGGTTYSARALVVPRVLGEDLDPLRLSRFQQAVFEGGGVINASLEDPAVPYTDRNEFLDHVWLLPVEDNIALEVASSSDDPEIASAVANVAADQLVAALNEVGTSAGVFFVHTQASPPADPDPQIGLITLVIIALLGGSGVAAGVVGTMSAFRRPLLSPQDAADVLGRPALGRLRLPAKTDRVDPRTVPGLASLIGRLYPESLGICAFIAPEDLVRTKLRVASLVARALARHSTVLYVAGNDDERVTDELLDPRILVRTMVEVDPRRFGGEPTVIAGPSHGVRDLPQYLPGEASVVVVVTEGASATALERLAEQFQPDQIAGVLFVQYEPQRNFRNPPTSPTPTGQGPAAIRHG
jgi:hypothetical protein